LIRGLFWNRHWGGHGYYGPGYWGPGPWRGQGGPQGPGGPEQAQYWRPGEPGSAGPGYYWYPGGPAGPAAEGGRPAGTPGADESAAGPGEQAPDEGSPRG
jgi:hypothetical protein